MVEFLVVVFFLFLFDDFDDVFVGLIIFVSWLVFFS